MQKTQLNTINNSTAGVVEVGDLVSVLTSMQKTDKSMDKSTQVTQMIPVPTSEHVAQIVGKNGSKIKFLRTETNTCIKTPYRGDEPVFVVTGQPENVRTAATAIERASQHFTQLMESRSNTCAAGETTVLVEVPQQYVGVVVGRNGAVIMRIKEQTNTRINTPKGDATNPAFEVTGTRVNVLSAKEAIHDRVFQAYQLRNSCKFDPTLNHHKIMNQLIQIQTPSLASNPSVPSNPSLPSPTHSLDLSLSPYKSLLSPMAAAATLPMSPSIFDPFFNYIQTDKNSIR